MLKSTLAQPIPPLLCPHCHQELLNTASWKVAEDQLVCGGCKSIFPTVCNAPFLVTYCKDDLLLLVETFAEVVNDHAVLEKGVPAAAPKPVVLPEVYRALQSWWEGASEEEVQQSAGYNSMPFWWPWRKAEFVEFQWASSGIEWEGKLVLDVGAGTGTDATLCAHRGATVLACEPNFLSLAHGQHAHPNFHWLGAVAHSLPLPSHCIDIVTCNASFHHHHDMEKSLSEMIRVLRPGGWLISAGDPFKASAAYYPPEHDWDEYDTHALVLKGFNEQVLRLSTIIEHIQKLPVGLEITIIVHDRKNNSHLSLDLDRAVTFVSAHPDSWGTFALRIRKPVEATTPITPVPPPVSLLDSVTMLQSIRQSGEAPFYLLSPLVSKDLVANELLSSDHQRWMQLNGWRKYAGGDCRIGYSKVRRFFESADSPLYLHVEAMVPVTPANHGEADIECLCNGRRLRETKTPRGLWFRWSIPIPSAGEPILSVEIRLSSSKPESGFELILENHIWFRCFEVQSIPWEELTWPDSLTSLPVLTSRHPDIQLVCGQNLDTARLAAMTLKNLMKSGTLAIFHDPQHHAIFSKLDLPIAGTSDSVPTLHSQSLVLLAGMSLPNAIHLAIKERRWPSGTVWWMDDTGCVRRLDLPKQGLLKEESTVDSLIDVQTLDLDTLRNMATLRNHELKILREQQDYIRCLQETSSYVEVRRVYGILDEQQKYIEHLKTELRQKKSEGHRDHGDEVSE